MTRAIAALVIIVSAFVAAALAPGCDRVVDLTPFYDAQPALDARTADGFFALDVGPPDGISFDDGRTAPDDGAPEDGAPGDGTIAPDDATAHD